jgi:hypothetical protein
LPGALTIVAGSGVGPLDISATTGVTQGHIVFQLNGSLNDVVLTNGSAIIGFTVRAISSVDGTELLSNLFTDSSFSFATNVGEAYDISITTENANGSTESTSVSRTSTEAASISGNIIALPAMETKSDLSSNEISLTWPLQIGGGIVMLNLTPVLVTILSYMIILVA